MAVKCGAVNPEASDSICYLKGPHGTHSDPQQRTWPNTELEEREKIRSTHSVKRRGKKRQPSLVSQLGDLAGSRRRRLEEERRSFNVRTKEEGMEAAATSATSENFRRTFYRAMAEIALSTETFSSNDVWDLLEARGYARGQGGERAQAAGTVGPNGCSLGLWEKTGEKVLNTSGNGHSTDNKVNVYRSKILGENAEDIQTIVDRKVAALDEKKSSD